jgi:vancomycin permeability regulator SanA
MSGEALQPSDIKDARPISKKSRRVWLKISFAIVGIVIVILLAVLIDVQLRFAGKITDPSGISKEPVAIVLGASVLSTGEPSDALQDRLDTALDLFRQGRADRILITGDDGRYRVDEISVMRDYLTKADVPWERIIVDGQGYRTYESCKRAVDVLGIKKAVVVTQRFHMGRALYLCNRLGMDAEGVAADRHPYVRIVYFWARDLTASLMAWWDVNVIPPKPPV